ncbi:MAG: hypothetical protein KC583_05970, partial [Myxococcales bacterium]|nr:hypothetical protein [Myxococcales bacterium]
MRTFLRLSFLSLSIVALLSACASDRTTAEADEEAEALDFTQKAAQCADGCCGSRFNCRVPDSARRRGCSGARLRNPVTGGCTFPLRADAGRALLDGRGQRIGEVRSAAVMLNQGIRKRLDGRWLVYVFNTTARLNDGELRPASGWLAQADLVHADRLHGYTLALDDPGRGTYQTRWRVVPGDRRRLGRLHLRDLHGKRYPATDYLLRPYGLVHLTYSVPGFNLGGHATDSFAPGAIFRRSKGVEQIVIPLYGPAGHRSASSLHFVYGYVYDGEQRRYGWIAKEALEPVKARPPARP